MNVNIGLALRPGSRWLRAQALQLCMCACADMRVRVCMFYVSPGAFVTAPEPSEDARPSAERILLGMCGG